MKPIPGLSVVDKIIAGEPLLVAAAIPMLIFPRGYLWQWQRGVYHYAPIDDPGLRYPGLLSWIGLALVALPWLLRWIRDGRPSRSTVLDLPIAIYLATAALSLWPSVDRAHSLNFLLLLVAGIAVTYAIVNAVDNEYHLGWALALFMACGVALAAAGLFQTGWAQSPQDLPLPFVYRRLQALPHLLGRTLNIGITAGASVLFVPLGVSLVLAARDRRLKLLAGLATAFIAAFLLLSQSRGDILALALTLPALWLWRRRRGHLWLAGLILGLTALIAALALYAPGVVDRIAFTYPGRWQVWERAAYIIRDHPLTGAGLDAFRLVAQSVYPYFDHAYDQTPMAHNRLLQVGADQGLVGLAAFVALIVLFYHANRRGWQLAPGLAVGAGAQRRWAAGLCASFTAFLLASVLDDGVLTGRAGLLVWYLLGLGLAQANLAAAARAASLSPLAALNKSWLRHPELCPERSDRICPERSDRIRGAALAGALLVLALGALVWRGEIWYNAANVARNRGWLAVDAPAGQRAASAARALRFYDLAGQRALRDRGALITLARDPARQGPGAAFFAPIAAQAPAEQGLADLEGAVRARPRDRFAHFFLAEAYRAAGRLAGAAAAYRQAGVPAEWLVVEARLRWDWGRGEVQAARDQLAIATLVDPGAAEAYYVLGLVDEKEGDAEGAAEQYRQAADLYRDQGLRSRAEEAYTRLLKVAPDSAYARAELAKLRASNP